jgi:hypothetical protein
MTPLRVGVGMARVPRGAVEAKVRTRLWEKRRIVAAALAAVAEASGGAARVRAGDVTLTKTSNSAWTITNGALTAVFSPTGEDLTSLKLGVGSGASANLISELDQEFAGTPFGAGTETFNSVMGPNNSYVDVWTNVASTGTSTNPITYAFHYVFFADDPTVHVYEVLNHAATDPATSVGQGQFLLRSVPADFTNLYQQDTGPNNLSAQQFLGIASTASNFSSVTGQAGRTVQNVTYDLTGSGLTGDNGTNFFTKYDYSTYTQFYQAETMYGSKYAVSEVVPSTESLTGGPTKQELAWTDPGILNLEFLSDHYGIDGTGSGAYPGYAYTPPQGVASTKLFGVYAFRVASDATETGAQINQDAINSIPNYDALYNTDSELIASGYVPTTARGSVQFSATNSAGWSAATSMNTVVLSDPNVNMQESTQGDQYWAQVNPNGTATLASVVPGTYRMTIYQLGQWGETRIDGVQVQSGKVTVPENVKFTPENFGTAPAIWTIGTPDRSAAEFMNGHNAQGQDQREYYGSYDYWGEEAALGNPGKVVYYATAVGSTPATNNPNDWIGTQWQTFNPGLHDAANGTDDNYTNIAPSYVTMGGGPANYHGSPWEVHFTATGAQIAQGQYVVISIGVVALDASLVISLNGHSETWSYNNFSPDDPQIRSGVAGFYQWAAFQFPVADLSAAGASNVLTLSPSSHADGVMYDALRMEITNKSASPTTTGWDDYTYISGSTQVPPNDAVGLAPTEVATIDGDANLDGQVNVSDLTLVLNNLGMTTSLWTQGNFDGATTVDLTDLNEVLNNLGMSASGNTAGGGAAGAVPEPASLGIVAVGGIALLRRERRARRAPLSV